MTNIYTDVDVGKRSSALETHHAKNRVEYLAKRDIFPLPPIVNAKRRKQCKKNFTLFAKTYFGPRCPDFEGNRKKLAKLLETSVLKNEQIVIGMPRGSGKSTLSRLLAIWATAYGHRKYVVYLCSSEEDAIATLSDIRHVLMSPIFREDFPEISEPFVQAEYFKKAYHYQLYNGNPTNIEKTRFKIRLANIRYAPSSSAVIQTGSLFGRVRGKNQSMDDFSLARPDLIIVDDPQSDAAAVNPERVHALKTVIQSGVKGMMIGGKNSSFVLAGTVIAPGDAMDQFLASTAYRTYRIKSLDKFPENLDLWNEWFDIYNRNRKHGFDFYKQNKTDLECGAVSNSVNFDKQRFKNVLQALMWEYIDDPPSFFSERQNEPMSEFGVENSGLSEEVLQGAENADTEETMPLFCGIDVHSDVLYWMVIGGSGDETFKIIDYGVFPDQPIHARRMSFRPYRKTFKTEPLKNALEALIDMVSDRHKKTKNFYIDGGWQPEVIESIAALDKRCKVARGYAPSENQRPISEWQIQPGDRRGGFWITKRPVGRVAATTMLDVNILKDAISQLSGDGKLDIRRTANHKELINQLTSEVPRFKEGTYSKNLWQLRPARQNHLLDCLVYAFAGALIEQGKTLDGGKVKPRR